MVKGTSAEGEASIRGIWNDTGRQPTTTRPIAIATPITSSVSERCGVGLDMGRIVHGPAPRARLSDLFGVVGRSANRKGYEGRAAGLSTASTAKLMVGPTHSSVHSVSVPSATRTVKTGVTLSCRSWICRYVSSK